ncbi:hypothetical protein Tco_0923554 [Tanacetum coccineum]|uniref:Uncharacterized protein n=1 Tax=Tanacetum coccineum TaxID=301880 RepID=A0ABQ5D1C4_9ASTR
MINLNKLMMKELILKIKRQMMMKKSLKMIEKELYGDVNVRLTDVKQDDEDKEDVDMTDVAHVQVEQTQEQTTGVQEESGLEMAHVQGQCMVQATTTATPAIQNATTESTETKVVSMMDINVQHEVPLTTITLLHSSIFPNLHQSTPILTPTNTEATILTHSILEYESLNAIHLRLSDLEKEVKELKNVDHSLALLSKIKSEVPNAIKEYLGTSLDDALYKVLKKHDVDIIKEFLVPTKIVERLTQQYLPQQSTKKSTKDIRKIKMEHASKHQVPKFTITSSNTAALEEFDQKTTLFNTMTKSKSFNKSIADELKKRKLDDADIDEGPSDGSDRRLKRQRTSKGTETSKKTSAIKDSSKRKSLATSSKSSKSGKSAKDQKSKSDTSPDPEWNEGKLVDDGPEQSWLNDMAKATKPPLTFDELMHTLIDFTTFAMNRLKIDNLTKEHLVGPVYNLLKGTCKNYVELDYTMEECYRVLSKQLDWNNPKGHRCPYDLTKPQPVQMTSQGHQIVPVGFFFNNDLEYLRGGSNDKKYTASTTKSKAARYELKGLSSQSALTSSPF